MCSKQCCLLCKIESWSYLGKIKDNTFITLLVQNDNRLYIGYNNAVNGVQLWSTVDGVTDPASEADFVQVSTSGFGDAFEQPKDLQRDIDSICG